jgi:hypothetical protein
MNRTLLTLALVVACSTAALAQGNASNPALEKKVRELLELTGATDMATQVMGTMMPQFKMMVPNVPESVWKDLEKEIDAKSLVELTIPIYIKEFTEKEIDAMLTFYRTPEGRSVVKKLPTVMMQSMMVGQEWGQQAAQRVLERLKAKGYEPKS